MEHKGTVCMPCRGSMYTAIMGQRAVGAHRVLPAGAHLRVSAVGELAQLTQRIRSLRERAAVCESSASKFETAGTSSCTQMDPVRMRLDLDVSEELESDGRRASHKDGFESSIPASL